jgi:hypothetical protein
MHFFLFRFTLVLNCVLFWKLLVFEFLLGISETLFCSMSAPHVKIVPLLDVLQLLMLFAGALRYSAPKAFSLIIFYNMLSLLLLLFVYNPFSPHNGITIANVPILLFSHVNGEPK